MKVMNFYKCDDETSPVCLTVVLTIGVGATASRQAVVCTLRNWGDIPPIHRD